MSLPPFPCTRPEVASATWKGVLAPAPGSSPGSRQLTPGRGGSQRGAPAARQRADERRCACNDVGACKGPADAGLAPGRGLRLGGGRRSARRLGAGAAVRARVDRCRRTAARPAFLVGIDRVMLEFVVEADVVHVLEDVELVAEDLHHAVAAAAQQRLGRRWHALIIPSGPLLTRTLFPGPARVIGVPASAGLEPADLAGGAPGRRSSRQWYADPAVRPRCRPRPRRAGGRRARGCGTRRSAMGSSFENRPQVIPNGRGRLLPRRLLPRGVPRCGPAPSRRTASAPAASPGSRPLAVPPLASDTAAAASAISRLSPSVCGFRR